MYPRFFFSLIGFGILIGVHGAFVAARWLAGRARAGGAPSPWGDRLATALIGAGIVLSAASLVPAWRLPKQDFVGAMRYVDAHRDPGDRVATTGATVLPYDEWLGRDWTAVASAADLATLRSGARVWLLYTFPRYLVRAAPEVHAVVDRECGSDVVFRGTVGGGDIHVCLLEPEP
jgi:uncharacterized membrane protein YeaQ/YmgE (transglycosylase-associated protein family)